MDRPPCKKCLLSDVDPGEELKKIQKLIDLLPEAEKASAPEYERRLTVCRACDLLAGGLCMACGCYVELRAIKRMSVCPQKNKWKMLQKES